ASSAIDAGFHVCSNASGGNSKRTRKMKLGICRVDIEIPPIGMLCIRCCLPLSIREVPHYSAVGDTSLPLTEPDLQFSHIRLFSYPHFAGDRVYRLRYILGVGRA